MVARRGSKTQGHGQGTDKNGSKPRARFGEFHLIWSSKFSINLTQ